MDAAKVYLADVLVANFPRVHPKAVHPAILPLALELVAAHEAMRATAAFEPALPVALVTRAVRVHADAHAVDFAVFHMASVLALHLTPACANRRQSKGRGGEQLQGCVA